MWKKLVCVIGVAASLLLLAPSVEAATVGRAVAVIGDDPDVATVGSTEVRAALGPLQPLNISFRSVMLPVPMA